MDTKATSSYVVLKQEQAQKSFSMRKSQSGTSPSKHTTDQNQSYQHSSINIINFSPTNLEEVLHWLFCFSVHKILTGLLSGNDMLPVDRTATAGRAILRVHPNGYTKDSDLKNLNTYDLDY